MRILAITDSQYFGGFPRSRTDDFQSAILAKLDEVNEIARRHGARLILHLGDVFQTPTVADGVLGALIRVIRRAPCPYLVLPGNHDLPAHNPENLRFSSLGVLEAAGLVHILRTSDEPWVETEGDFEVAITGREFFPDLDRRPWRQDYLRPRSGHWHLHCVHGMAVPQPLPFGAPHTLVGDVLAEMEYDLLLTGHWHFPFEVVTTDAGTGRRAAINPGALARYTADPRDMARMPQVLIIEVTQNNLTWTYEPITSARPGEEVLTRAHLDEAHFKEARLAEFLAGVEGSGAAQAPDLETILADIAAREGVPQEVRDEALRRIAAAREALAVGEVG